MPFSHYYGLWKNIPHCLTQIQMGLTGRLPVKAEPIPALSAERPDEEKRRRRLQSHAANV